MSMKDYYSINEVALMTGLSTKTLRNYISAGFLEGEKCDGNWKFSIEAIGKMFNDSFVDTSIKIKNNSVVKDFLSDEKKKEDSICFILDKKIQGDNVALISEFLCEALNQEDNRVVMKFSQKNGNARIILSGPSVQVMPIIISINNMFQ